MAVNIYLVFFRNWSTRQLRGLDHKYFIACYGISIIPAIFLLFVETKERGKVYGHAIVSIRSNQNLAESSTNACVALVLDWFKLGFPSHRGTIWFHVVIFHPSSLVFLPVF